MKLCHGFCCQRKKKQNGAKLELEVELRGKIMLESSETNQNVVGNDTIEKKKCDAEAEAISLRRQKGRNIEKKRVRTREKLTLAQEIPPLESRQGTEVGQSTQVQLKVDPYISGGNVWKLSSDCFYF